MANAKMTLYSFYRWFKIVNLDLFEELEIPEGIDKQRLIDTILLRGGEFETQFDSADMVKFQLGVVSRNWSDTFKRWYEALAKQYDPLENYDRKEDWSDHSEGTSNSHAGSSNTHGSTDTVSAFNSSALVNDSGKSSIDSANTDANGSAESHSTHTGRIHGNIGVTTNDQMLRSFMSTREAWGNLYDHIADVILREIIIPIY